MFRLLCSLADWPTGQSHCKSELLARSVLDMQKACEWHVPREVQNVISRLVHRLGGQKRPLQSLAWSPALPAQAVPRIDSGGSAATSKSVN